MIIQRVVMTLNGAAIRVQLPLVLAAIPVTAALLGVALLPVALDIVGVDARSASAAKTGLGVVLGTVVAGVAVSTLGAAMLLRGSIRATVERMREATDAIAGGEFRHRVQPRRRDELGRLGQSIDTMAERLERLEQARRRLIASVSHELRTPLTIIRMHSYSLAQSDLDQGRRERLELVQAETVRLADLIDDLVQASALDAGGVRLNSARHDLRDLVRDATHRFEARARSCGVTLELGEAPVRARMVDVDAGRFEQMLANLLVNALRHAEPESTVRVRLEGSVTGPRRVLVSNVGRIDPGMEASIFEPFVQGAKRTGRIGLGLAITHGLAAAHGGRLTLERSGADDGVVEFAVQLPAPPRVAPARTHAASPRIAADATRLAPT